jgi:hypothetical protein
MHRKYWYMLSPLLALFWTDFVFLELPLGLDELEPDPASQRVAEVELLCDNLPDAQRLPRLLFFRTLKQQSVSFTFP